MVILLLVLVQIQCQEHVLDIQHHMVHGQIGLLLVVVHQALNNVNIEQYIIKIKDNQTIIFYLNIIKIIIKNNTLHYYLSMEKL